MFEANHPAKTTNPLAVLKPARQPRLYTLEEYLRFEARTQDKHEYYNGKIVKMPYARGPHNIISANIGFQLNLAIESLETNYVVLSSDQKIYLPQLNFGLFADAVTVCEKPEYWDSGELLLINPLLIVEVLSKSTQKYDRSGKFDEYKTLSSFREYMLVRQDICQVETRFREEPGLWRETVVTDREASVSLRSIGCSLPMKGIYKNVEV